MEHVGIDLHKNQSQICTLTENGALVYICIRTKCSRSAVVRGDQLKARMLIEASSAKDWWTTSVC